MCTVLLAWRCVPAAHAILAANRDEFFGRPSTEPTVLLERPRVVGGRDRAAGGTWMAVSGDGRLALITNRLDADIDPTRRSRGELPLSVLTSTDRASPIGVVSRLDATLYNAFNLLYVSSSSAVVGHFRGDGGTEVRALEPGLHVLTLYDMDQPGNAKVAFLRAALLQPLAARPDPLVLLARMESLLTDHGCEERRDLDCGCVHADSYGTVSSSSVVLWESGDITFRHAQGPPCQASYTDISALLR